MKNYILQIAGGAFLAVFADIFSPSEQKKYINVVTGIILITIIMTPIAKIKNIDIESGFENFAETSAAEDGEKIYSDILKREFSKRLATDIKERIKNEFAEDVSVETVIETNDRGEISEIKKIVINGTEDEKISERIAYVYNVKEVVTNAGK